MINLGAKAKDSITGFSGIAVARTTYLNGCVRILLEAKPNKDGKPREWWFDEQRLGPSAATTGGPGAVPPARDPE